MKIAIQNIEKELEERLKELREENKLLEAQRLEQRTNYDLEMMREMGFCSGIENYSRHLTLRAPGSTPYTLLDYFPEDFLVVIDESHEPSRKFAACITATGHEKNARRTWFPPSFRAG